MDFKGWLYGEGRHADEMFVPSSIEDRRVVGWKSMSRLVRMSIDDYLALARPGFSASKSAGVRAKYDSGDLEEYIPELWVGGSGGEHRVVGHEGRHRAMELRRRGYTHMPVLIRHERIRWDRQGNPADFDYLRDWPISLRSEDGGTVLPFPLGRDEAGEPYR